MTFKKPILIIIMAICFFMTASCICAADNTNTTAGDASCDIIPVNGFDALNKDIQNLRPGDVYEVNNDYFFNNKNANCTDRIIKINVNDLTINGNGHVIDAGGTSSGFSIFEVNANNVKISNLTFTNSHPKGEMIVKKEFNYMFVNSPVSWKGNNGVLSNCNFYDNSAVNGGALSWSGTNGVIKDCNFINNTACGVGGAIYINAKSNTISNSNFINCSSKLMGETIYADCSKKYIKLNNLTTDNYSNLIRYAKSNIDVNYLYYTYPMDLGGVDKSGIVDLIPILYKSIMQGSLVEGNRNYYSEYDNANRKFVLKVHTNCGTLSKDVNGVVLNEFEFNVKHDNNDIFNSLLNHHFKESSSEVLTALVNNQNDYWGIFTKERALPSLSSKNINHNRILEVNFTKSIYIKSTYCWNVKELGFNRININGNGSTIHAKTKPSQEFKWAITAENYAFSANNIIVEGFNQAIINNGFCTLNNLTLQNNKMDYVIQKDWGAAIYNTGKCLCVNCSFTKNYAQQGGAVYSDTDMTFIDCTFSYNTAYGKCGGAIYSKGKVTAINTNFYSNEAHDSGGAIYSKDCVDLKGCLLDSNVAQGAMTIKCLGGALYSGMHVNLNNCTFRNNYVADRGGAIYCEGKVNIDINSNNTGIFTSFFIKNKANAYDGGAIYAKNIVTGFNTIFSENKAHDCSGAIYSTEQINLNNCLLDSNVAEGAKVITCKGGAIYSGKEANINNCIFKNNYVADNGGAIYAKGNVNIDYFNSKHHSLFINNRANAHNGGAIYSESYVNAYNSILIDNSAHIRGGAIACEGSVSLWNTLLKTNTAEGALIHDGLGGGVYSKSEVFIYNSTFDENKCIKRAAGGAIYAKGNIYINKDQKNLYSHFRNNIAQNSVGGAIYSKSDVYCWYSLFELNQADDCSAIRAKHIELFNVEHHHNLGKEFSSNINDNMDYSSLKKQLMITKTNFDDLSSVSLNKNNVSFWIDNSGDLKNLFNFIETKKPAWKLINMTLAPYTTFEAGFSDYHKYCLHLNHANLCIKGNINSVIKGNENNFIHVGNTATLSLVNVTLQNFRHCFVNKGTVYCKNSYFFDNDPQDHDTPKQEYEYTSVSGGVIENYGSACFDKCVFRGNHATINSDPKDYNKWWEFWGAILYAGTKSVNIFHDCDFKNSGHRFIKACDYSMTVIYQKDNLDDLFNQCYFDQTACLSTVSSTAKEGYVSIKCSDINQMKEAFYMINSLVPNCKSVVVDLQPGVYEIKSGWLSKEGEMRSMDWRDEFYHRSVAITHTGVPDRIERFALDVGIIPIVINGNGAVIKMDNPNIDDHFAFISHGGSLSLNNVTLSNFNGVFHNYGTLSLNNCSLLDNKRFGSLFSIDGSTYFTNCTFNGNGGIVDAKNGFIRFNNCNFIHATDNSKFLGKVSRCIVEGSSDLKSSIDLCDGSFFYRFGAVDGDSSHKYGDIYNVTIVNNNYLPALRDEITRLEPSKLIMNITCDCDVNLDKLNYDGDLFIYGNDHKVNFNFGNAVNINKGSVTFVDLLFKDYSHILFNVERSCVFIRCNFTDNNGKYLIENKGACSFTNCHFEGNKNGGNLIFNNGGSVIICNSTFYGNSYGEYGLIYNFKSCFAGVNLNFINNGAVSVANFETDDCGIFNCTGCSLVNDYDKYSTFQKNLIRTALMWAAGIASFATGFAISSIFVPLTGLGVAASVALDVVLTTGAGFGIGVGFGNLDDSIIGGSARDHSNRFDVISQYVAVSVASAWAGGILGFIKPLIVWKTIRIPIYETYYEQGDGDLLGFDEAEFEKANKIEYKKIKKTESNINSQINKKGTTVKKCYNALINELDSKNLDYNEAVIKTSRLEALISGSSQTNRDFCHRVFQFLYDKYSNIWNTGGYSNGDQTMYLFFVNGVSSRYVR